jgi:hypothetical protein|tara:strand:+ start:716 stop:901 length:186 start_codon:yes stop_codon:yes gene_type:complete
MDEVVLAQRLRASIKERRGRISEMVVSGSAKNMEEYKQLVGNIESLDYIEQVLREILDEAD